MMALSKGWNETDLHGSLRLVAAVFGMPILVADQPVDFPALLTRWPRTIAAKTTLTRRVMTQP